MKKITQELIIEKKKKNVEYLFEMQKFLDVANNIEDTEFRERIIFQMLKVDEALTKVLEQAINN